MSHDLSDKRVSADDAIIEMMRARAELAKTKKELAAVTKDRDEVLIEYGALRDARYPVKRAKRPPAAKRGGITRVIAGDVHGSMMDRQAVDAFLDDLAKWNPDEIVLLGDIVECGGFLSAHHALGYVAQTSYSWQEDIAAGNWFLDRIRESAPKATVHYTEGNHESRLERWIADQTMRHSRDANFLMQLIAPEVLLRLKERGIHYYRRSETYIPGYPPGWIKLGKVHFVHELSGGKNAARDSVQRTAGNVVFGHTHREDTASVVLPGVGLVKAFNPGCLCQRQPLWRHSDPTGWSQGYAVEFVEDSGEFLHFHIPIWEGRSLAGSLLSNRK